eukprot:9307134-Pyramimonas_sp.AAC.2
MAIERRGSGGDANVRTSSRSRAAWWNSCSRSSTQAHGTPLVGVRAASASERTSSLDSSCT